VQNISNNLKSMPILNGAQIVEITLDDKRAIGKYF
jgi:hypothetical protein